MPYYPLIEPQIVILNLFGTPLQIGQGFALIESYIYATAKNLLRDGRRRNPSVNGFKCNNFCFCQPVLLKFDAMIIGTV